MTLALPNCSVENESLEFESLMSNLESSRVILSKLLKSSLFLPRFESFQHFIALV